MLVFDFVGNAVIQHQHGAPERRAPFLAIFTKIRILSLAVRSWS